MQASRLHHPLVEPLNRRLHCRPEVPRQNRRKCPALGRHQSMVWSKPPGCGPPLPPICRYRATSGRAGLSWSKPARRWAKCSVGRAHKRPVYAHARRSIMPCNPHVRTLRVRFTICSNNFRHQLNLPLPHMTDFIHSASYWIRKAFNLLKHIMLR